MNITATRELRARISKDGRNIVIQGEYRPELLDALRSLPSARWHRKWGCWTCDLTSAAAWRLRLLGTAFDGTVDDLATRFHESVRLAPQAAERIDPRTRGGVPTETTPWRHQTAAFHFANSLDAALLAMDMGTGKSLVVVALHAKWRCKQTLILCPKSVLRVWPREFKQHAIEPSEIVVLDRGTVAKKAATAILERERCGRIGKPLVLVINYESAWRSAFGKWALEQSWDLVVLDESHRVKAHNSKVSKFAAKLGRQARRRLCLTGTPMPHSPLDLFGQYRFLDAGMFGTSWYHFRNRYARTDNPAIPQMVTGYQNEAELEQRFAMLAYRCEASDVLDLPDKMHHVLPVTLGAKAAKAYREMERELIAEIEGGECTAANALVRVVRLQQVTSGYLPLDDSERKVEIDSAKEEALADLLEDLGPGEPVVVFCKFRHDLDRTQRVAEKLGRRYAELSGRRRDGLSAAATMAPEAQVLGAQIASGGVGIDLTRARYAVYYSQVYSLGDYEQSLARLHRPGATRTVHYYHLIAEGTVDRAIYRALERRRDDVETILEALKGART